ncbi:MAG: HD domain-containing protein [Chloroflexi bacterium]|nr:HD domain-containing protein [Chloroflexota bacterium]
MPETQPELGFSSPDDASGPHTVRGVFLSALAAPGAAARLRQLDASGLLTQVIPELETLKGVAQPKEHHWDVFGHCLETVAAVEFVVEQAGGDWPETGLDIYLSQATDGEHSRLVLLKLAGLLHDVAKPQTKFIEPQGKMRFFGHSELGAQTARRVLARLGFSSKAQQMVGLMIEHHLRPPMLTLDPKPPTDRAIRRFFRDTAGVGIETFLLNLSDHKAMRGPMLSPEEWQQHMDRTRDILRRYLATQQETKMAKLVDGDEIMKRFGLQPGPILGELLAAVREAQGRGDVTSKEEAMALVDRMFSRP